MSTVTNDPTLETALPSSRRRGMLEDMDMLPAKLDLPTPVRRRVQFRLRSLLVMATLLSVPFGWLGRRMEQIRRERAPDAQRLRILDEIESLGSHSWAGEYSGDGLIGVSLILAPSSGYLFESYGCMGLVERNYGPVRENKGRLHLEFTLPRESHVLSQELIPVAWGSREYLIPAGRMIDFCNDVNAGDGALRWLSWHLLRRSDAKKRTEGLPSVPDEFKRYLLACPIEAEIIAVGARTADKTPVVLGRGEKHGLLPGMTLCLVKSDGFVEFVVTQVEDERSNAIMLWLFEDEPEPQIGWKVSTSRGWNTGD